MSNVVAKNYQVGTSGTASNNFTLYQPSSPDGTVRLGVGNAGATSSDAVEFNSSAGISKVGGYPAYQCRAWVNFNGSGTVAIRASGNVSSITDNGAGNYTVNFTTALPDVNYAPIYYNEGGFDVMRYQSSGTQNTNNCQIRTGYISGSSLIQADIGTICAAFFR